MPRRSRSKAKAGSAAGTQAVSPASASPGVPSLGGESRGCVGARGTRAERASRSGACERLAAHAATRIGSTPGH